MKKSFSARRVPRKVGEDDDEDKPAATPSADPSPSSTGQRLKLKPRNSLGPRQFSRPSLNDDEDESGATVITPKRSNISRVAIQRNASKRSSLLATQLPTRESIDDDDRPNYSAASLQELKDSTPSTPQHVNSTSSTDIDDVLSSTQTLNLSSKFGSSLARYHESAVSATIPSATEIAEKKARRARLAKEQEADEYISLDPDDPSFDEDDNVMKDESGRLVLKPKDKYGQLQSRLVPDDEDIMENFEEFTEDGKIALGHKEEVEAARKRKQEIAAQIAEAEGTSDLDSEDGEIERNAAFEAAQTKHGTYGQKAPPSNPADVRPKTPPIITPLPTLDGVIGRLRKQLADMQSSRMQKLQEMESLQREKIRLAEEEIRIQHALKETAEKFAALRKEKGIHNIETNRSAIEAAPALGLTGAKKEYQANSNNGNQEVEHEFENEDKDGVEDADEDIINTSGFGGPGFGASRRGLGAGLGFAVGEDNDA